MRRGSRGTVGVTLILYCVRTLFSRLLTGDVMAKMGRPRKSLEDLKKSGSFRPGLHRDRAAEEAHSPGFSPALSRIDSPAAAKPAPCPPDLDGVAAEWPDRALGRPTARHGLQLARRGTALPRVARGPRADFQRPRPGPPWRRNRGRGRGSDPQPVRPHAGGPCTPARGAPRVGTGLAAAGGVERSPRVLARSREPRVAESSSPRKIPTSAGVQILGTGEAAD